VPGFWGSRGSHKLKPEPCLKRKNVFHLIFYFHLVTIRSFHSIHDAIDCSVLPPLWELLGGKVEHCDQAVVSYRRCGNYLGAKLNTVIKLYSPVHAAELCGLVTMQPATDMSDASDVGCG